MASKRRLRREQCTSKRSYPDQTSAVRAMIGFRRAFPNDRVRTYRCRFAGHWHFGHF